MKKILCGGCATEKAPFEFSFKHKASGRLQARCKDCQARYRKRHYEIHREKYKSKATAWNRANPLNAAYFKIKKHYTGTYSEFVAEVNHMRLSQGGKCAACFRAEGELAVSLCIDHCHRTGKLRGLLCHWCNTALGLLGDDPDRMKRLIKYASSS